MAQPPTLDLLTMRGPETAFDALDVCHRHTALALGRLAALITQLLRGAA